MVTFLDCRREPEDLEKTQDTQKRSKNQPGIILEPTRPSQSPIMHMFGIAAEKPLGVYLSNFPGFVETTTTDTLHCTISF